MKGVLRRIAAHLTAIKPRLGAPSSSSFVFSISSHSHNQTNISNYLHPLSPNNFTSFSTNLKMKFSLAAVAGFASAALAASLPEAFTLVADGGETVVTDGRTSSI